MNITLTGISSMATRQVLADLAADWQHFGGTVSFESVGGLDAAKRVQGGDPFDIVVLAADAIDKLVASGRIIPDTSAGLVRSVVAMAVRAGARRPVIDTEEALRAAVMSARSVGYSTGPSGVALQRLFERWAIGPSAGPRTVQAPTGVPVATMIARGEVELGFQQLSELMHVEGIDIVGAMPPGLEIVTTFSGGVCTGSTQVEAARAFLDFIRSPVADAAKWRHGMQPT
jgi:molybdate transport system substrate-binding protein